MFPHELIQARLSDLLGRRRLALGPLADELLTPLALGLLDQLSAYLDCRPGARLRLGSAALREGDDRAYLFVSLFDGRRPLRLRAAMDYWHPTLVSSRPDAWVEAHNARRWRFLDRHRGLIERLGQVVADAVLDYVLRRPGARLRVAPDATPRIVEGVAATYVVVELDDRREFLRAPAQHPSDARRYRMP